MIKNQLRKKYNLKNLKFPIEYYIYDLLLVYTCDNYYKDRICKL